MSTPRESSRGGKRINPQSRKRKTADANSTQHLIIQHRGPNEKDCRMRISNNDMIYSAVILILAISSLKMKQIVVFLFCSSRAVEHGRRQPGTKEPWPPWIFKHGTNIVVKRRLECYFSAFFCYFSVFFPWAPPGRG